MARISTRTFVLKSVTGIKKPLVVNTIDEAKKHDSGERKREKKKKLGAIR